MRSTPAPTARRRLAATALAGLSLLGVLGLDAKPAAAAAPDAPRPMLAAGYHDYARVYWAPPAAGDDVDTYQVQRTAINSEVVQKAWSVGSTKAIVDTGLQPGTSYRYKIRAVNEDGASSWTQVIGYTNPNRDDLYKFGTDTEAFVTRQYQDFLGRKPSPFELATDAQAIDFGDKTPEQVIEELVFDPQRQGQRSPVIRLYRAFFKRAPDHGGLDYWVAKRKSGTTTLNKIAAQFAGSNEFKTKYGTVSNAKFIDLIYANLFDRSPDPSGKAYWTKKLDQGMSRGEVMVQFSESNEYRNRSFGVVTAADVRDDMLDAAGAANTVDTWGAHLQDGGEAGTMALSITLLNDY
jgi:hypothetical protein